MTSRSSGLALPALAELGQRVIVRNDPTGLHVVQAGLNGLAEVHLAHEIVTQGVRWEPANRPMGFCS